MMEWAEREVYEFIRKHEDNTYVKGCCNSALKAYHSLMEDGHSGSSISLTKNILNKLIEGKPLTPIEDIPDIWEYYCTNSDGSRAYRCTRMSSLFKTVDNNMNSTYSDVNRVECIDISDANFYYYSDIAARYVDEREPIEMPYSGDDKYTFTTDRFLLDEKNEDYDFFALLAMRHNDSPVHSFNPIYYDIRSNGGPIKISSGTYEEYKNIAKNRKK